MAAKKEFFIRVKDELVEVTQEVYLTYYRGKRGEETQLEKIRRNHVVSYDAFDTKSALGAEMLIDTASDEPEDIVIARLMSEKLHDILQQQTQRTASQAETGKGKASRHGQRLFSGSHPRAHGCAGGWAGFP